MDAIDLQSAHAGGTPEYAAVVAEAIEDYIATDGWQTAPPGVITEEG